jgi:hypothetical protein
MIELRIDDEKIEKYKVEGYGSELIAELCIGVSVLLYGMGGNREKGYEFWRKILTKRILTYEKVKELFEDEG